MKLFDKKALAIALLAGSTLSLPALAQDSSGGSADPKLLPKAGTTNQGSSSGSQGNQATSPDAGSAGQSAGATNSDAKQPAQGQAQSEQLRKPGDAGSATSKDGKSAATQDNQRKTGSDAAQTEDQNKKKMNQDAAAGSKTDQTKQSAQGSGTSGSTKETDAATGTTRSSQDTNQDTASGTQQRQSNDTDSASADRPSNEVTGSINISTEQKTEIRNIIVENKVEPIKPSFSVSVGVAIPKTVELHPLPPRVVEILPAYRSYRYFVLADNRIVIVEPDTYEIVYILVV